MTIFRHSNYAVPTSRTGSFSPIVTSALAPALGQKGAQNVRHPIAQLKTLFNFRFKLMKHPISQNIISRRFFAGTLAVIFSAVSFSVPSPAFAIGPNQNPIKIFSDDFESGTSKWGHFGDKISNEQVHSGTKALLYDGWPGTAVNLRPTREVYLSFWWYMPTRFDGGHAGGRHFWRLGLEGTEQIDTQAQSKPNGFSLVYFLGGETFYPNVTQLPTGRWFKLDFYVQLNDPGVANGETMLWIDGVEKLRRTNVSFKATSNGFDQLHLTSNYDNCKGVCSWYMDDVQVWNGCPSGSSCNGGPSPVGLAPPSNLQVVPAP